ncbi:MAG: hypothetical protein Q8N98_05180 [bacterium]|nr:hypothetical protein [bacterium]
METLVIILLAIIAYILWFIYRQKEEEKEQITEEKERIASEKSDAELAEWEAEKEAKKEAENKEEFKDYPHLIGKVDYEWLELFGKFYVEKNFPHLNFAFLTYLHESNNTKLGMVEVDRLFDSLWHLIEELLEHLEKYHESTEYEYEIAISAFWQIAAQEADSFIGKDIETIKKMFRSSPFTDIQKILSWFPKRSNHPDKELSFTDGKGMFPRESKGSEVIKKRLKDLGL